MIIFFNKKTGEIIGAIEGRVHPAHHNKMGISVSGIDSANIGKIVIGWTEDNRGKRIEHNMSLWEYQLISEDHKHPKHNLKAKVKINKGGDVLGLEFAL